MFKIISLVLLVGLSVPVISLADKSGSCSPTQKEICHEVARLQKVVPSTSTLMLQMEDRYRNLYWAAKQMKWKFAEYQAEEIEEIIETLKITRPKRAATATEFINTMYPKLGNAIKTKDWDKFNTAFKQLGAACMVCHAKNNHAFIVLPAAPAKPSSLVLETR